MSAISQASRARPQARKKVNDDASYSGPPTAVVGTKRQATERLEGEPRVKRKRADAGMALPVMRDGADTENRISLVEFDKLELPTLYRYLTQFDLLPSINPSPLRAEDPPPPTSLANPQPQRLISRPPSPMLANRPPGKDRRRSSRLLEEEETPSRMPVRADIDELHSVLASVADKHFREVLSINGREEVDTLASFMCAVEKAKGIRGR